MAEVFWEWQNPFGWSQYDEEASTAIENAYQQKQKAVYLLEGQYGANGGYLLSLDRMTQTNMDSGNERKIRRRAADETEAPAENRRDRKERRAERSLLHDNHDALEEDDWDDSNSSQAVSQGYSRHVLRSQVQKLGQSRSNSGSLTRLIPPSRSSSDLSQSNAPTTTNTHFLRSGSQSLSRSNSTNNLSQPSISGYHSRNSSSLSQSSTTHASSTNAPTTTKRQRSDKSEKSSQWYPDPESSLPLPIPKKKATGASSPVPSPSQPAPSYPTLGLAPPPFAFRTMPAAASFPLAHYDDSFLSFQGAVPIKKDKHGRQSHHASLHSPHSSSGRILVRSDPTTAIELDLAYKIFTDRDAVNDDAPLVEIRLK